MSQIFHPSMNALAKASIFAAVFILGGLGWVAASVNESPYMTNQGVVRDQPVPFSHEHHVKGLGLDCRYCHTSVQDSHFAGIPPTKTCMTCHSKIWTDAELLAPVRQSWDTKIPIKWTRVHNLPDFVYFQHDIHVTKGVGCTTCHGQVNEMPLMFQNASLQMQWCLDCHRKPENFLRPRADIFNMNYKVEDGIKEINDANVTPNKIVDQITLGNELVKLYHVPTDGRMTNCYMCHR
jgi:hypothetical protein